jgi:hypothetical protein
VVNNQDNRKHEQSLEPGQSGHLAARPRAIARLADLLAEQPGARDGQDLGRGHRPGDPARRSDIAAGKITTGSGSVNGTISRYLIISEDGALWTGGIDPTSSSDQSNLLSAMLTYDGANAGLIDQITVSAPTTAYYFRWRSLQSMLGNVPAMPRSWSTTSRAKCSAPPPATTPRGM